MKVALTGATGYIGSHVLAELQEHGHEVTAVVQDGAWADTVAARGAKAAVATSTTGSYRKSDGRLTDR
jgi:uncharacterized protein YbjT (DUF2867 family)